VLGRQDRQAPGSAPRSRKGHGRFLVRGGGDKPRAGALIPASPRSLPAILPRREGHMASLETRSPSSGRTAVSLGSATDRPIQFSKNSRCTCSSAARLDLGVRLPGRREGKKWGRAGARPRDQRITALLRRTSSPSTWSFSSLGPVDPVCRRRNGAGIRPDCDVRGRMPQDPDCVNSGVVDFFIGLWHPISNCRGWGAATLQIPRQGREGAKVGSAKLTLGRRKLTATRLEPTASQGQLTTARRPRS
jgi:hypothetical protein